MMLSIQEVTKMTGLTSRALRVYEEVGILNADDRLPSGVRLYAPASVEKLRQILAMKAAGITLRDVSALLDPTPGQPALDGIFRNRLEKIETQITSLQERRDALGRFLSSHEALGSLGIGKAFGLSERDRMELYALDRLERGASGDDAANDYAAYLKTELDCFTALPETFALIPALKRVIEFAAAHKITIGPGRGTAPASLLFHLMGLTKRDPVRGRLKPAVVFSASKAMWIDVSYDRGGPLVDLCDELSVGLRPWKIEAFRLPLLDIIEQVHAKLGHAVPYDEIADDAPEVLAPFRTGDCEKILWFDEPATTMAERLFPEQLPEWAGHRRLDEYLRSQRIDSFADVLNIMALRRPYSAENLARMDDYAARKRDDAPPRDDRFPHTYGMIIYHEDIIDLIAAATSWDALRVNQFRCRAMKKVLTADDRRAFLEEGSEAVLREIEAHAPFGFSRAHVVSSSELVKRCAVLKSRYRDLYYSEIKRWEDAHGLSWSDFGFHNEKVCLLK